MAFDRCGACHDCLEGSKAEYFSSGVEGALILLASASSAWTAVPRLVTPRPLEQVGIGLAVSVVVALLNFAVARRLLDAGNKYRSNTLEADAQHLLTDVPPFQNCLAFVASRLR